MASPLVGVALINSLLFGVYGWTLDQLSVQHPNDPPISRFVLSPFGYCIPLKSKNNSIFLAGSFSGLINAFFSCPMELLKIRLQNQGSNGASHLYSGPLDCVRKIVKTSGFKGLYRGFGTTLIRETPSYGGVCFIDS
jgi:solute carrier family 25 carnitine/acylcarnitine transporter 20/29